MAYTFDKANANAPSTRTTQYFEMFGNRAIYHDGWIAATTPPAPPWLMGTAKLPDVVNGYKWELYNLNDDYSEYNDLAAKYPDRLREMQELFLVEATKYNVFPLDNSVLTRAITPRPSATAGRTLFTYPGEMAGLPLSDAPSILNKSYTITAEVEIPQGGPRECSSPWVAASAATASTCSRENQFSPTTCLTWSVSAGKASRRSRLASTPLCLTSNTTDPASARAAAAFCRLMASKWTARRCPTPFRSSCPLTRPSTLASILRTPVDDKDYQVPFRFHGKLDKLTVNLKPEPMSAEDQRRWTKRPGGSIWRPSDLQ